LSLFIFASSITFFYIHFIYFFYLNAGFFDFFFIFFVFYYRINYRSKRNFSFTIKIVSWKIYTNFFFIFGMFLVICKKKLCCVSWRIFILIWLIKFMLKLLLLRLLYLIFGFLIFIIRFLLKWLFVLVLFIILLLFYFLLNQRHIGEVIIVLISLRVIVVKIAVLWSQAWIRLTFHLQINHRSPWL